MVGYRGTFAFGRDMSDVKVSNDDEDKKMTIMMRMKMMTYEDDSMKVNQTQLVKMFPESLHLFKSPPAFTELVIR